MHNIYSYHAKFNPIIPNKYIKKYSKENDIILDPFCGSGTTLLEGLKLKRDVIGIDISPIAFLNSKVKTNFYNRNEFETYLYDILNDKKIEPLIPNFPDKDIWYNKQTLIDLGKINKKINSIKVEKYKNLFLLILLSILKNCSRNRETWNIGYIADNCLPNKDKNINVYNTFERKCKTVIKSINEEEYQNSSKCILSDVKLINNLSVDLVVTSPPYPFAVDFIKYHRLALYWLGENVNVLSEKEIGARNKRSKRNSTEEFYDEMYKVYIHVMKMVKKNGYWCMTIANTTKKNEKIKFIDWTIQLFESNNWLLVEDKTRELQHQTMGQKRIKTESILVFKKMEH